jgi:hypothetical protein
MQSFITASEVKAYLKAKGITFPVKVKSTSSPFDGRRFFSVAPKDMPQGVSIVSSSGSSTPTTWGSFDGGQSAKPFAALQEASQGTNLIVSTR